MNYLTQYNIEKYIFETVTKRFEDQGFINTYDFFCIVIWKANRAKSKIAKLLMKHSNDFKNLDEAVYALTNGISDQPNEGEKLRYIMKEWRFQLPMATAILTALYPTKFTVYDVRVCDQLGDNKYHKLKNKVNFDSIWNGYEEYLWQVKQVTPTGLTLREKDQYLWGKSFHQQLENDISQGFKKR